MYPTFTLINDVTGETIKLSWGDFLAVKIGVHDLRESVKNEPEGCVLGPVTALEIRLIQLEYATYFTSEN